MCTVCGVSQIAVAFPCKAFQQIPSANTATGKPRPFLHHAENCVFVPSRLTTVTLLTSISSLRPSRSRFAFLQVAEKFADPGFAESSFHNQLALCSGVDDRNLEHIDFVTDRVGHGECQNPRKRNLLKGLIKAKISGELCQRLSKTNLTFEGDTDRTGNRRRKREERTTRNKLST